jgi:hypothetical protein
MPNQLDLPDDLKHLIEKRDDGQRRERSEPVPDDSDAERRQGGRRTEDAGQGTPEKDESSGGHQVQ